MVDVWSYIADILKNEIGQGNFPFSHRKYSLHPESCLSRLEALHCESERQRQMFYLCESEASAANVLSVRKRSVSYKAPSRNGNQPLVLPKSTL